MIKDIFFFPISTDEDLSFVLEFSGLDLSGRDFQILIKDRASGTTRASCAGDLKRCSVAPSK